MSIETFEVEFDGRCLRGDHWRPEATRASALILHGGGTSSAMGQAPFREFLFAQGVATTAFDFFGHGRSDGTLIGSSLAERSAAVDAVIDARQLQPRKLTVIGFSMGGHIAALAAQRQGFAALGLVIAAAYSSSAAGLKFGPDFAAAIRQPLSWQDSDAFTAVAAYRGRLQIISAGADAVVPAEIQQRYFDAAQHCVSRHHEIVAGSPHDLGKHFAQAPQDQTRAYDLLAALTIGAIIPI